MQLYSGASGNVAATYPQSIYSFDYISFEMTGDGYGFPHFYSQEQLQLMLYYFYSYGYGYGYGYGSVAQTIYNGRPGAICALSFVCPNKEIYSYFYGTGHKANTFQGGASNNNDWNANLLFRMCGFRHK